MNKLIILSICFFCLVGCSVKNEKPHFEKIKPDYLNRNFQFTTNEDFIDTLIRTKNYEFYYVADNHEWDADHYFFLKRNNELFKLEPVNEIENGFKTLQIIDDSTLVFYTQFYNRIYGDFWVIKNGNSTEIKLDPGIISNTNEHDLIYRKGILEFVGANKVQIDSMQLKKLKNKLYKLENNSLIEVSTFKDFKTDIDSLNNGVYYFSYPGRHISDTLFLNQ